MVADFNLIEYLWQLSRHPFGAVGRVDIASIGGATSDEWNVTPKPADVWVGRRGCQVGQDTDASCVAGYLPGQQARCCPPYGDDKLMV
jgi:hypothetical protein